MIEHSIFHGASVRFDYSKLRERVVECFGKQCVFAAAMGLSERSMSLKLNAHRGWTNQEIHRACEVLMIPRDDIPKYFFVEDTQY